MLKHCGRTIGTSGMIGVDGVPLGVSPLASDVGAPTG